LGLGFGPGTKLYFKPNQIINKEQLQQFYEFLKTPKEKDFTLQRLWQWFCSEMLRLGASETHVDAVLWKSAKISFG
jgi:hypothetical protein